MASCSIIYGTAWKKEQTTSLVIKAVLNGFRAIDTAAQLKHYREDLVGEALRVLQEKHGIKREGLYIQTKYTPLGGQDPSQPLPYNPKDEVDDQVQASVEQSLLNLGTTYVDCVLLHSPFEQYSKTLQAWQTLIKLQDAGTVRSIGLSNTYDVRILERLESETGRRVQVVQNRWYEGNHWDRDVCSYCKRNGVQYQSFWTLSGSPRLLTHPSLRAIARATNCTTAQALFKIAQLQGITPLSGTTSEQHMEEDVAVEDISIDHAEITGDTELGAAFREIKGLVWGPLATR